jgi:hypothetical protein
VLYVDAAEFCGWYFDKDTIQGITEDIMNGERVALQTLFKDVGYLPLRLIKNPDNLYPEDRFADENEEIEDSGKDYDLRFAQEREERA